MGGKLCGCNNNPGISAEANLVRKINMTKYRYILIKLKN
jgi:hypothetical protein